MPALTFMSAEAVAQSWRRGKATAVCFALMAAFPALQYKTGQGVAPATRAELPPNESFKPNALRASA